MDSVVLASTSPWRRRMLEAAGIRCEGVDPGPVEEDVVGADPVDTARLRALAKARSVAARRPGALVVGADQVVHLDGESIGKPVDTEDWRARLLSFRGRWHALTTAVALQDASGVEVFDVTSRVVFRADLRDDEIDAYIAWGEGRGCAGGYMIEERGAWLVEQVEGDWSNVVGLPIFELVARLRRRRWGLCADGVARGG